MDNKMISKEDFDKAVTAVITQEVNDPKLEGMGKILIPMVGAIFAGKIANVLFGEKEDTSNG